MPNLEAAAALLGGPTVTESTESTAETTETSGTEAGEAQSTSGQLEASAESEKTESVVDVAAEEAKRKSEESAARLEEMRARIERLKVKSVESREAAKLKAERQELERIREIAKREAQEAAAERQKWAAALEDPLNGFKALGYDASDVYDKVTRKVLQQDTPEEKEAALAAKIRAELLKELEPKLTKSEELEKRLAEAEAREQARLHREFMLQKHAAESEFLSIVHGNGYEMLADHYEDSDLIEYGDKYANHLSNSGKQFTIKDVVELMKQDLELQLQRAEQRRNQRNPVTQSADSQTSTAEKTANSAKSPPGPANTVTNNMASASATVAKPAKTKAERRLEAERMLKI